GSCQAERSTTTLPSRDECRFGDRSASKTVVLFGDSHATMWLPALDLLGRRDHVAVVLLAKSACPAASLSVWDASRNRAYPECDTWRRAALDRVAELKPDLVVLSSQGAIGGVAVDGELAATDTEQAWSEGLTATLTAVRRTGARAVVLGDIPFLSRPAPSCLPLHIDDVGACARPAAQAVPAAHNAMERTTAARNRAGYLDVTSWLCTDTVCPAAIAGIVSYYNLRHVSASYARHLAGPLGSQLQLADL
ncbi:MAG: hypothetical protein JWP61_1554, partial [Friedmanniella sp.]|nr:hypothetical protein [Friedmanniella sp.]